MIDWDEIMNDMDSRSELICDEAGHDFQEAGGGMLICSVCLAEQWSTKYTDDDFA